MTIFEGGEAPWINGTTPDFVTSSAQILGPRVLFTVETAPDIKDVISYDRGSKCGGQYGVLQVTLHVYSLSPLWYFSWRVLTELV